MKMRKVLSFILVLAILLPIFAATPVNAVVPKPITASYAYEPFEIQKQDKWEKEKIGGKGTLSDCGCGIFALYNAVLALTGKTMNITEIAQWAFENDGHDGFDAYRDPLYGKATKEYGSTYGFMIIDPDNDPNKIGKYGSADSRELIDHLKNGYVAIGHMPGHFVALVGYNEATDKILVHDSAPSTKRQTEKSGNWLSTDILTKEGAKSKIDWFCLIKPLALSDSTLKISPTKRTYTITEGSKCNIGGTITSNFKIEKIVGTLDSAKKAYCSITDFSSKDADNYNISDPNGLNSFDGSALSVGTHYLDITATDATGRTASLTITIVVNPKTTLPMYRMYNPNTGEHLYTGSTVERDDLISFGWRYEGVAFNFSPKYGVPVYRLFEPSTGEHLYTKDENEKNRLLQEGWTYENVAFNSGGKVAHYRLHNPNAEVGAYHFTSSIEERDNLIAAGWECQGIGFYSY